MSRIEQPTAYVGAYEIRTARAGELAGVAALRRRVFVEEQGVFAEDDRDEVDAVATPLVALAGGAVARFWDWRALPYLALGRAPEAAHA